MLRFLAAYQMKRGELPSDFISDQRTDEAVCEQWWSYLIKLICPELWRRLQFFPLRLVTRQTSLSFDVGVARWVTVASSG